MLLDAEAVASGQAAPKYTRADYEQAMVELAASVGGDPVVAYAGLLAARDPRMGALYVAARLADMWAGRAEDTGLHWKLLSDLAETLRKEGESARDSLERLIKTDALAAAGYRQCCQEAIQ